MHLIHDLLKGEPKKRPSVKEILRSKYLRKKAQILQLNTSKKALMPNKSLSSASMGEIMPVQKSFRDNLNPAVFPVSKEQS